MGCLLCAGEVAVSERWGKVVVGGSFRLSINSQIRVR
jgi:hypothetical protein